MKDGNYSNFDLTEYTLGYPYFNLFCSFVKVSWKKIGFLTKSRKNLLTNQTAYAIIVKQNVLQR
jgi:hypothetical protein